MATSVSSSEQDKKGKSRSEEKSERRKRRREEGSENKTSGRRKSSKSERGSSGAGTKKKVRTISELVKLVISGEVKVPKTLGHYYVEDRVQLLDQVFTILSEDDVRGMLPDILKGLKLRQVRQMCLEQLKAMSGEDVMDCIEPQTATNSLNLDAAVLELLGNQATSVGTAEQQTASGVENPVPPTAAGGDDTSGVVAPIKVTSIKEGEEETETGRKSSGSDDGGEITEKVEFSPISRDESPPQTMECDTTTSDISREERPTTAWEEKGEEERESERESVSSEEEDESSESDLDDCWLCDFPDEVSEWARLREIEFRQRALEAELRRRGEKVEVGREREEGREDVVVSQGAKVDKSKAIELQLRQRALQSLLAKKKEQQP